jgi:ribosomal protein S18 acetylase RimI-like enzyme
VPRGITIDHCLERNDCLLEIADFQFSKFTEDPELLKRGGNRVYHQWLINSFGNAEKHFSISKDNEGIVNGFLLHSYSDNACVVELIAVSSNKAHSGIGTRLFSSVESSAFQCGFTQMRVGTQVRNRAAINFYHKVGCKQVGCHQVYHLWNI